MAEEETPDTVTFDDNRPKSGYAMLTFGIPGLLVKKAIFGEATAKNAQFNEKDVMFQERQLEFKVCVTVESAKSVKYSFKKSLPLAIKPDQSHFKVKKNYVEVVLCKAEDRSWSPYEQEMMTSD